MNPLLFDYTMFTSIPKWLLGLILAWSLFWKGLAMWKSAHKNSPIWFIIILVTNTIGILEILYLYVFSEIKFDDKKKGKEKKQKKGKKNAKKAFFD